MCVEDKVVLSILCDICQFWYTTKSLQQNSKNESRFNVFCAEIGSSENLLNDVQNEIIAKAPQCHFLVGHVTLIT